MMRKNYLDKLRAIKSERKLKGKGIKNYIFRKFTNGFRFIKKKDIYLNWIINVFLYFVTLIFPHLIFVLLNLLSSLSHRLSLTCLSNCAAVCKTLCHFLISTLCKLSCCCKRLIQSSSVFGVFLKEKRHIWKIIFLPHTRSR